MKLFVQTHPLTKTKTASWWLVCFCVLGLLLAAGEYPPAEFTRNKVAEVLVQAYSNQFASTR
jgi:ATP sulfurylase